MYWLEPIVTSISLFKYYENIETVMLLLRGFSPMEAMLEYKKLSQMKIIVSTVLYLQYGCRENPLLNSPLPAGFVFNKTISFPVSIQ